jgi:predicted GNAT family acetyltransferase
MNRDARRDRDADIDEALEETFPASDPPANTVETGIHLNAEEPHAPAVVVRDNREANRFEAVVDGQTAFLQYERRSPRAIVLVHTEVPEALRHGGIGGELVRFALQSARAEGLTIVAQCPFVRDYLKKHPADGSARGAS